MKYMTQTSDLKIKYIHLNNLDQRRNQNRNYKLLRKRVKKRVKIIEMYKNCIGRCIALNSFTIKEKLLIVQDLSNYLRKLEKQQDKCKEISKIKLIRR